jgi:restriction endonuclease S subunit
VSAHRPYGEYRSARISWLDKFPSAWELSKLKYGLSDIGSGGTPETGVPENWTDDDEGYPWVAIADMTGQSRITSTEKRITQKGFDEKKLNLWPEGTLLFSMYASLGTVSELGVAACTNQAILALVAREDVFQAYLKWWLIYIQPYLIEGASSNTQANLNADKVKNLPLLKPSYDEQKKIANFLDRETRKIDNLIEKQEELIALLNEEVQSITSRYLMRGLKADNNLINSGVPWLGNIPGHWKVKKIKYCVSLIQEKTEEKTNVIALENIESWTGNIIETESTFDGDSISFKEGDVLFGKLRPYLAKVLLAENSGQAFGDILVFRAREGLNPSYLFRTLLNSEFINLVNSSTYGTKMPRANWDFIGNIKIAVAPMDEQVEIVNKINSKTLIFKKLMSNVKKSIELLKERRASLISAAVTGKIDVRE